MRNPPESGKSAGPLLALDSSTATGSVAVGDADRLLAEVVLAVGAGASSALLPAAEQALHSAGLTPRDLGGVVVAGGPGSFTGLRIAAATAKGIVQGLGVPLFAYSGLLAAAAAHWAAPGPVWALFDARRRDVFAACYAFGDRVEERAAPAALALDEVIARAREQGGGALFAGDGALLHREEILAAGVGRVAPAHLALPRASSLLWLAQAEPARGRVADPLAWEPEYGRAAGVERIAAARAPQGEAR